MSSLSPTPDFSSKNMQCNKVQPFYQITIPQQTNPEPTQAVESKTIMKQTAVEFLHSEYKKIFGNNIVSVEQAFKMSDVLSEALEMEKEQIVDAFWNGDNTDCLSEQNSKEFAEQYYNKTYTKL